MTSDKEIAIIQYLDYWYVSELTNNNLYFVFIYGKRFQDYSEAIIYAQNHWSAFNNLNIITHQITQQGFNQSD